MLFHIQATHSYETCLANDPEKKKILRNALKSAEQKGVKIHNLVSSRPAHTLWMIVEAETFADVASLFEFHLGMGPVEVLPVHDSVQRRKEMGHWGSN